jgi:hypothetical protein
MKKYIYEEREFPILSKFVKTVNDEPECGEDFCDSCGDCLHCYGGDECLENEGGEHLWVEYIEREIELPAERLAILDS